MVHIRVGPSPAGSYAILIPMTLILASTFVVLAAAIGFGVLRQRVRDFWAVEAAYEGEENDWMA